MFFLGPCRAKVPNAKVWFRCSSKANHLAAASSCCFQIAFKMLPNVSRMFQILPNASKMLQNASKCFRMIPNASKCFQHASKWLENASKCIQNASKMLRKCFHNACKCLKILPKCIPTASNLFQTEQTRTENKQKTSNPHVFQDWGMRRVTNWHWGHNFPL